MERNEFAPLVGHYLHSYDQGELGYQGKVIDVTRSKVFVRLFSWRDGTVGDVISFTRTFVERNCKLYADRATWCSTGAAEMAASQYWRRWNGPAKKPVVPPESAFA
jgi:hypothetical protein